MLPHDGAISNHSSLTSQMSFSKCLPKLAVCPGERAVKAAWPCCVLLTDPQRPALTAISSAARSCPAMGAPAPSRWEEEGKHDAMRCDESCTSLSFSA